MSTMVPTGAQRMVVSVVDPQQWAVDPGYHDTSGRWREAPEATVTSVLESMGALEADASHPDSDPALTLTVRLDHPLPALPGGVVVLEDGGELPVVDGRLPAEPPLGYHRLVVDDGPERRLVVCPGRCPEPVGSRWGWAAQLYAVRSADSWGIGDLADLRRLTSWGRTLGAELTLLNPLHAGPPGPHPQPSPYFPSSRCFANPLYLRVEDVAGAEGLDDLEGLAAGGRELNRQRLIDRERVWALKSEALEAIFARTGSSPATVSGLDRYIAERGDALLGFATFNALAEIHGLPWQSWPPELRDHRSPAVAAFATSAEGGRRVRYHAWLQWQIDRQLAASAPAELIFDVAVGVDAGGADTWMWPETFATGMRVGAPPDDFNRLGQDWGLPPWDPWRLRSAGYEPFVQTLRAALRHSAGLRVDHVMGLFRLYWIPAGVGADAGTYVRYPYWDLLNILSLEAHRAGAFVVGEDLGTVEDAVRAELSERRVLSYRVLWFEPERPAAWAPEALAAVTTHDLPTVAGLWTGQDLEAQRRLGLDPNEDGSAGIVRRLADWAGIAPGAEPAEAVRSAYRLLAEAPCRVLTVSLDDVAVVAERPNMPGTLDEWPNWSLALPVPVEQLEASPLPAAVAAEMNGGPREPGSGERPGVGVGVPGGAGTARG
jgi:4-alpha-glucanotransferase